jgi:hypothetical protein
VSLSRLRRIGLLVAASCSSGCGADAPVDPSPASGCAGLPGVTCFGRQNYVEYVPGAAAVVVSVPHGGTLAPAAIPDRTVGTSATDLNTIELGRALAAAISSRTGQAPHLVISHLRRTKMDANREVVEAAQGQPDATTAWTEYHGFIDQAVRAVAAAGSGFYVDLHGHAHPVPRLELGYLLSSTTLALSDADLNSSATASASSLRG